MRYMSDDQNTRASLILRLQRPDDVQAWEDFAEIYQPLIYSLARRRGLQDADAFDLKHKRQLFTWAAAKIENQSSKRRANL